MLSRKLILITAGTLTFAWASSCRRSQSPRPSSLRAGAGLTRTVVTSPAGQAELRITAYFDTTTAWVNGTVTDSTTKQPIPAASVTLRHLLTNQVESAVSDAQGKFVFRHILGPYWKLTAQASQYTWYELDTLKLGGAEFDLRIKLIPRK
ncbi:carboxypeptidase-like regulatory domain-containing protein [Hymenobacter coalescens]